MSSWRKPVVTLYRERFEKPEREAFAVVQAQKLIVGKKAQSSKFDCNLKDFFPLMGNIDFLSTDEGKANSYILCWFDDGIEDFANAFRRLSGVVFPEGVSFETDEKGKKTYNAFFVAEHAKLK